MSDPCRGDWGHPQTHVQISRRLFFRFSKNRLTWVIGLKTVKSAIRGHHTYSCEILRCKGPPLAYPNRPAAAGIRPDTQGSVEHIGGRAVGCEVHVHSCRSRLGRLLAAIGIAHCIGLSIPFSLTKGSAVGAIATSMSSEPPPVPHMSSQ